MRLADKVAVVTGAGSGIGRQTAILFAAEGAQVVVVDRHEEDAQNTVAMIATEAGRDGQAHPFRADVANESDIAELARECDRRYRRVDVLVNNAAIRAYGPVTETDQASWDEIFSVNLRGAALVAKHLIPLMARGGGGAIVNVSSVHAIAGRPDLIQYDTMKAGLLGMTRSLACDHADAGIRVNAVLPGLTLTEYHIRRAEAAGEPIDESVTERRYDGGPGLLGRQAKPREIAYANLFLASDEASYITGTSLPVDGGVSAYVPS